MLKKMLFKNDNLTHVTNEFCLMLVVTWMFNVVQAFVWSILLCSKTRPSCFNRNRIIISLNIFNLYYENLICFIKWTSFYRSQRCIYLLFLLMAIDKWFKIPTSSLGTFLVVCSFIWLNYIFSTVFEGF